MKLNKLQEHNLHIDYKNLHNEKSAVIVQSAILRSLIYFDLFNYPLTEAEIVQYSGVQLTNLSQVEDALETLTESLMVFRFGEFYSLKNDAAIAQRRIKGNKSAAEVMPKALRRSNFIQKFPFVRSVNISGSLSKNYFDETTDFDFFIITSPGRIWIARILLTFYKKLFLLNNRKYFCINYYISSDELEIPDQNLFSATEIITLKNQTGEIFYKQFIESNAWVKLHFPNFIPDYYHMEVPQKQFLKKRIENLLKGKFGDRLDDIAWRITLRFLKKRYMHLNADEFKVNMRTKKNASKHHPQGFQFKVLKAFDEKCRDFEVTHQFKLI